MRNIAVLISVLLCQNFVLAQEFIEVDTALPFPKVNSASLAYVDIDGDFDEDLVLLGWDNLNDIYTDLFINDGGGNFVEDTSLSFEPVHNGSIATADIDGDDDQDILICGRNESFETRTSLYINQGNGSFSEDSSNTFEDIANGEVSFCDVDGDSDQDVFVIGQNKSFEDIAKLYLNDGGGVFEELQGTSFIGVRWTAIAIGDVDNDTDPDIIISGRDASAGPNTQLYINAGNGTFSRVENSNLVPVYDGSIALSDVDGDADLDLLITGWAVEYITKLYLNDGMGAFSEAAEQDFPGVREGVGVFEDIDKDADKDLFITGLNQALDSEVKFYLNDGSGKFTEVVTPVKSIYNGAVGFSDIDGDDDSDLLVVGYNSEEFFICKQYINESDVSTIFISKEESIWLNVYPNPAIAKEISIFVNDALNRNLNIKLYNLEMKLLVEENFIGSNDNQKFTLRSLHLNQGCYIVVISDNHGIYTQKMVMVL